jgi:hypothetical protein
MTNGEKINKTNGKEKNGEKIIPKESWTEFNKYWLETEWASLTIADIKKHLGNGKYVFEPIPKNVTDRTAGTEWFNKMKHFREKTTGGFGGYTVCFKGQKSTLEEVFSDKPLNPATMVKQLHLYINDHKLSSRKSETKTKPEENGKTVKVNNVAELEKVVEKVKPKKGK